MSEKEKINLICIVGTGHCGSTLFLLLCSRFKSFLTVGEFHTFHHDYALAKKDSKFYEEPLVSFLESKLPSHPFSITSDKKSFLRLGRFPNCYYNKTGEAVDAYEYAKMYHDVFLHLLEQTGKKVVVCSCVPNMVEHPILLQKSGLFDVTTVFLVRSGPAVVWSYMKKYQRPLEQIARWVRVNLKLVFFLSRYRIPVSYLRYEKLVQQPEKLDDWISDNFISEIPQKEPLGEYLVGGNRMKFESKFLVKKDDKWRVDMPFLSKLLASLLTYPVVWLISLIYSSRKLL